MKRGHLSEYFVGFATKRLSAVETDPSASHQHEFNGVSVFRELFGAEHRTFQARFVYWSDEDEPLFEEASLTWYDARRNHPNRTEYRLYFPTTAVSERSSEGDLLLIALQRSGAVVAVVAAADSTAERQLLWLFGAELSGTAAFEVRTVADEKDTPLSLPARTLVESLGIEIEETDESLLGALARFNNEFPTTRVFSEFARGTLPDVDAREDPDAALIAWMDREEVLFKTLERAIVEERLHTGFAGDVDGFIAFSLSVQNRRKARAGQALEHHVERVLLDHEIQYTRGARTENFARPDFLFPSARAYHDPRFPPARLSMLGVKSTCKDRWRQVLAEAARIQPKHLLTLEPGISINQTSEMSESGVQLVLPRSLHETFLPIQRQALMTLAEFVGRVKSRQEMT